jgi:ribosomal protein S18 acetylase RimI-like enzyme
MRWPRVWRLLTPQREIQAVVSRQLTSDIEQHTAEYLALEYTASAPYNCFVFDDQAQADEIRKLLFSSGACEYGPPFGKVLLKDNSPAGMLACLTGKQVTSIRLKGALALLRKGIFARWPALQQRLQLAGQTLLKPQPEDFYLSRIAVAINERGQGTGSLLMDHFEQAGYTLKCQRLTLEVNAVDEQAIAFYLKHKFAELNQRRVVDLATGRTLEYLHMVKPLV